MKKIMIMAGEASGDLHGANLARELTRQDPGIVVFGVGSSKMREAGVHLLADASEISVVGVTEVMTHIRPICRVFKLLKRFLRNERPDLLILIDFPDFNIMLGKRAKQLGIPVLYYISPQVWVWRKGRIKTIAGLVQAIIVALPFEVPIYQQAGVDVRFAGHPLADVVVSSLTKAEARRRFGLDREGRTVALLPGSRRSEIENLLPDMLKAAEILKRRFPDTQFILPVAHTLKREFIEQFTRQCNAAVMLADGSVYDVLRAADAALVTSGTATLETGLMTVPMAVVYRISRLSYLIGRMIIDVDHIGLVNIVAGRRIVPEFVQNEVTPENMAGVIAHLFEDRAYHDAMLADLRALRERIGEPGVAGRIASLMLQFLRNGAMPK